MVNLLTIENLTKSVGDRVLFKDISFGIDEGEKIAIVARNGTGKSTLLSIIAGDRTPDSGSVVMRRGLRIGYLPQEPIFNGNDTVAQAAMNTDDTNAAIVRRYLSALGTTDEEATRNAIDAMDTAGAWDYQDRLTSTLSRLGLTDTNMPVRLLSGGQRKRLALARIVMLNPDFLLLDEPTNHLDISVIEWLEDYLKRSRATLLMVTHDRYFLDRICSRIIEMSSKTIFSVNGNYDTYLARRAERIEAVEAEQSRVRNILRREQQWISRNPQARGTKAKFRIDNYRELCSREYLETKEKNIRLETASARVGNKIFEAEGISKSFGAKIILRNFSYTFAKGEKIGIIGANGVGKSTFVKMLLGLEPCDSGSWNVGETVRFGYYSQDGISFDDTKTVIDAVQALTEDVTLGDGYHLSPMQYLQHFLFSPADQQKYIYKLSGGERCRLHLAVVLMKQPNFLILDEPTNDLDIVTLGILEEYLSDYKGCAIVISHDRYFLDNIVDHLFVMEGDGIVRDFPGNYSDYRQWLTEKTKIEATAVIKQPRQENRHADRPQRLSYKEKQEMEALEKELAQLNAEKDEIEAFFAAGGSGDYDAKSKRLGAIVALLDEKEMRWLTLSEKQ